MMKPIEALLNEMDNGQTSAEILLDQCLAQIDDPTGEGERVMLKVHRNAARAAAQAEDLKRQAGLPVGVMSGIPVSIKDLCDMAGDVTKAGSVVLKDASSAAEDAPIIKRLRAAGAVIIGRTNMTEFAYSGVGINPHYDTPANPHDRATRRIPGGSSSGAAVSVADGMAAIGMGTDTGGSCRIPAALCGTVGYKPTAKRIPIDGIVPLSVSLDSVGSMGASVRCVARMDAVMAGETFMPLNPLPLAGLRLGLIENIVLNGIETHVQTQFFNAVAKLKAAGAQIERVQVETLGKLGSLLNKGGIAAAEAYTWHEQLLADGADSYDHRVAFRISAGATQSATDYMKTVAARARLQQAYQQEVRHFDAMIMPTVPIVAPPIAAFAKDAEFFRLNGMLLRNTAIANTLDLCAISLPCHTEGAPVGFSLVGQHMGDRRLLEMAAAVEALLAEAGHGGEF
ncbi:MAG: amidase [Candidatus Promineifilaceae bacterium]